MAADGKVALPPPMDGVLETVLYYPGSVEREIGRFYGAVLGMPVIGRAEGRFHFFRVGPGVLLLFNREASLAQESPPPHGAVGPGHSCLRVPSDAYSRWKIHLSREGVRWHHESTWPGGGRSFYFDDPAGNVLEIADRDIWLPSPG